MDKQKVKIDGLKLKPMLGRTIAHALIRDEAGVVIVTERRLAEILMIASSNYDVQNYQHVLEWLIIKNGLAS